MVQSFDLKLHRQYYRLSSSSNPLLPLPSSSLSSLPTSRSPSLLSSSIRLPSPFISFPLLPFVPLLSPGMISSSGVTSLSKLSFISSPGVSIPSSSGGGSWSSALQPVTKNTARSDPISVKNHFLFIAYSPF